MRASTVFVWMLSTLLMSATSADIVRLKGAKPRLSEERMVFQTKYGNLEMAFYPDVAPATVAHIIKVAKMGGYTQNHFFRVDKGFVAQVSDVMSGQSGSEVSLGLDQTQRQEGAKSVPGEFSDVKHTRGILSMGRWDDPNSATSSFSILLGNAPHLDEKYCVFGELITGDEVLTKLETLETVRQGMFVMPKERITIYNSYIVEASDQPSKQTPAHHMACDRELSACQAHVDTLTKDLQTARQGLLP